MQKQQNRHVKQINNKQIARHYTKHQIQTKNWKGKQYTPKSKIANEGGPWQT